MFLLSDGNPMKDVYYIGSKLIEIFNNSKSKKIDFFESFQMLKEQENITMNLYILTIDWLFILGLVKHGSKGCIEKCF